MRILISERRSSQSPAPFSLTGPDRSQILSILFALLLKTKKCCELLQADEERGERAHEWDLLELSA